MARTPTATNFGAVGLSYLESYQYTATSNGISSFGRPLPSQATAVGNYAPTPTIRDQFTTPDKFTDYESYNVPGWDGYDADPITIETVQAARYFARQLPRHLLPADIAPGADGTIGFEWQMGGNGDKSETIFVEVGPGDTISAFRERISGRQLIPKGQMHLNVQEIIDQFFSGDYERV